METNVTPMMKQYMAIKEKHQDAILFFRLGDFYEMFFDDAIEATRILHITLTSRSANKGKKVPMCGIPYHAAGNYIARLVKSGKKVAICEQVEEPIQGKKIVEREVVKIITPGTFIAEGALEETVNNYILSLNSDGKSFGMAFCDLSTGEFRLTELEREEDVFSELYKVSPAECLVSEDFSKKDEFKQFKDTGLGSLTVKEDWLFDYGLSLKEIKQHFSVDTLEGFGCTGMDLAVGAAGALLKYLKNTQKSELDNIKKFSTYKVSQYMSIDRNSQRHLELVQNQEDLSTNNTLFEMLNRTNTPMGARKLKRWLLNPLLDTKQIHSRQEVVQFFFDKGLLCEKTRDSLKEIYDIERLSNKVSLETANARDMVSLAISLKNIKGIKALLKEEVPVQLKDIISTIDDFSDVTGEIESCLGEEPPVSIKEGGIIKKGYDDKIDELKELITNGKDWVASLQREEIEKTGINSLKVGYSKVFGYFIEVTNSNLDSVPDNYIRKQTLTNCERFITPELKEEEAKILGAEDRIKSLEYEIFCQLRLRIAKQIKRFNSASEAIAQIDCLSTFAQVAAAAGYTRPIVTESDQLELTEARHPVLENILKEKEFVPNDLKMDQNEDRIFIITGSNMAGKSTFIRQIALISIMAQIGSFVPASKAELGIIDSIFTRVGASDRLYRGMSTFMVEMVETANILNNATNKSLIILDEIGRGTSTFDGVSIAWAVVEYINKNLPGAKAMFATHYHELTELTGIMNGVKNFHLAIQQWGEKIIFLYKVTEGSCDESFGVHVAKLAGMPKEVITRAREILKNLQKDSLLGNIRSRFFHEEKKHDSQLDFFDNRTLPHPVIERLKDIDVNKLTPLEALEMLAEFKKEIKD